jgi:hypothetical protein
MGVEARKEIVDVNETLTDALKTTDALNNKTHG